ncbi:hypothetical protein GIB67_029310 [Kingdonia uniflora]|uniref:Chlororespiratory reduction31 n=1 Tax=Kingdonia uniflora TaxID=39325 RepID=A0A7J7N8A3_9MAGN|nr:hypothetical protein GIB67_029310 [Kingdonia uniflora]
MASFTLPLLQKSSFLGEKLTNHHLPHKPSPRLQPQNLHPTTTTTTTAKFNLFEVLGGRGLLNGEQGLQIELKKPVQPQERTTNTGTPTTSTTTTSDDISAINERENAFEKELLGLTGGFPGGEKGLRNFIEKNPPPKKSVSISSQETGVSVLKPKPPTLTLLMPGMIAIVKNPDNPFYMYCGIIQRITDGRAGVLFEEGNWDKLITFRLDELERREKGPPMVNPNSAILESMVQKET